MNDPIETSQMVFQLAAGFDAGAQAADWFAGHSGGLNRSQDGGQTWQPALASLQLTEALPVVSLAVSPEFDKDRTLFAGLPGGLLRSTDGGTTWKALSLPPPPPYVTCLAVSPGYLEDGTVIAGTAEDGILMSNNGGDTWRAWNFGLIEPEVLSLVVSPAFQKDETLFCGTASGIFRSTNGGRAWRELALPPGFVPVLSLALSPNFEADQTLYAGTEESGLFRSRDAGETWEPLGEDLSQNPVNAFVAGESGQGAVWLLALWGGELILSRYGNTWETLRLPVGEGQATAVFAPDGLAPGLPLLVGLAGGQVLRVDLPVS